jgi:hypothetical protein
MGPGMVAGGVVLAAMPAAPATDGGVLLAGGVLGVLVIVPLGTTGFETGTTGDPPLPPPLGLVEAPTVPAAPLPAAAVATPPDSAAGSPPQAKSTRPPAKPAIIPVRITLLTTHSPA